MADMSIRDGKFLLALSISASGTKTYTLSTQNKFVDKNIDVETTTPAGVLSSGATTISATDVESIITVGTTQPSSGEYITVTAQGAVSVGTGGFIAQGASANSTSATKYITLQNATFTVDGASVKSVQKGYVGANQTLGTIPSGAQTITGGTLSKGAGSTALASNGLSNGTTVDSTKKVTLSETNANGYYEVQSSGSGTVSRGAVTKQVTTAGYFSADSSAVTEIDSASETSNTATKKYYIKQSTMTATSVTPATTAQTVTISAGYYHEDRTVTVSAMAGTTVTTSLANTGLSTYFNEGTSSSYGVSITPQYSNSAGFVDAHTNANNGGIAYYNIKTTSVTKTTTTVSGTSATRGTASWGTGWITADSISACSFNNEATSGRTYVDISATTSAPVLVAGDYLYINAGYTDDVKISLAKLVPDGSDVGDHDDYILQGHSAYNNDGVLVAGSIPTYDGAYTVA